MPVAAPTLVAQRSELEALLARRPQQPYAFYRNLVCREALAGLALKRAWALLENPGSSCVLKRRERAVAGLACWSRLDWDSRQFGTPAARLDLLLHEGTYAEARAGKAWLLAEVLRECRHSGIRHLTARVDAGDFSSLHALEETGFELIDGIQTFSRRVAAPAAAPVENGFQVRMFDPADLPGVLAIARSAYLYDRFHADQSLSRQVADGVNEEWTRRCCQGAAADAVVVAVEGPRVLGYVTCKVDRQAADVLGVSFGSIVLVATAEDARGRGVARQTTLGALEWFRRHGVAAVEVGTQLRNVPAARLYESCGFRLVGVTLTLRRLL